MYRNHHREKYVAGICPKVHTTNSKRPKALEKLQEIKKDAESSDVYLVYVCSRENQYQRFLLMDIISLLTMALTNIKKLHINRGYTLKTAKCINAQ